MINEKYKFSTHVDVFLLISVYLLIDACCTLAFQQHRFNGF